MKLRIQFSKKGPVKFIGHLDTMRFFQRALKRACFDLTHSQGFSPHPIMAFAAPLGVGIESDSECFDVEVVSISDSEDMMRRLNAQMCEGIEIRDIRLLPEKSENAMASVKGAAYTVDIEELCKLNQADNIYTDYYFGSDSNEVHQVDEHYTGIDNLDHISQINNMIADMMSRQEILITKKTKKNELTVDIRQGIYELTYDESGLHMTVDASSGGNIRPEQVVEALFKPDTKPNKRVTRNEIYTRNDEGLLVPLIEIGTVF